MLSAQFLSLQDVFVKIGFQFYIFTKMFVKLYDFDLNIMLMTNGRQ